MLTVTEKERQYLLDLLESRHKELIHELDHTDTRGYKQVVRTNIEIVEGLIKKLQSESA